MLLNCDNTNADFQRLCPCIPLPLKNHETVATKDAVLEPPPIYTLLANLPTGTNIEVGQLKKNLMFNNS